MLQRLLPTWRFAYVHSSGTLIPPTQATAIGRPAGELAHVVTSQTMEGPQETCMREYVGQAYLLEGLGSLPDAVALADTLPPVLQGLDPAAPTGRVPDPGGLDWLPDMSFAHVGQPWMTNAFQVWPRSCAALLCPPAPVSLCTQA